MLVENGGVGMTMPMVPAYGNCNGNNDGFDNGWVDYLITLSYEWLG